MYEKTLSKATTKAPTKATTNIVQTVSERRGVDFDDVVETSTTVTDHPVVENPGRNNHNSHNLDGRSKYYKPSDSSARTIGTRTPCGDLFDKYNVNLNVEGEKRVDLRREFGLTFRFFLPHSHLRRTRSA